MSCKAALASLRRKVIEATPTVEADAPFFALEDEATGAVVDVEDVPDDVTRLFDFRIDGLPADAYEAGHGVHHFTVPMRLRVRYPAGDRQRAFEVMTADAEVLATVLRSPAGWDASISTVEGPTGGTIAELAAPGAKPHAYVASLPFRLTYTTDA